MWGWWWGANSLPRTGPCTCCNTHCCLHTHLKEYLCPWQWLSRLYETIFLWFTKTPYRPDCSLKKARFSPVAILYRIVPGPVVPASSHNHCFGRIALAEGTDKGSAVPAMWHGGTTTSNTLVTLWRVTRKAAPGDNYNWCANGELLAAKRQTFPSGFCCALVPIDYWGKCIMLAKISFPWSDVCFISHINASMTLSLLQHIKHLGNVSLNSRSVLWNPSTWE